MKNLLSVQAIKFVEIVLVEGMLVTLQMHFSMKHNDRRKLKDILKMTNNLNIPRRPQIRPLKNRSVESEIIHILLMIFFTIKYEFNLITEKKF